MSLEGCVHHRRAFAKLVCCRGGGGDVGVQEHGGCLRAWWLDMRCTGTRGFGLGVGGGCVRGGIGRRWVGFLGWDRRQE